LPLQLLRFLDDAHQRGVLRRTGPVYQFRHAILQRTLASSIDDDSAQQRSSGENRDRLS